MNALKASCKLAFRWRTWLCCTLCLVSMTVPTVCGAAKLKNVLYFVIDDLRPQLGAYDQHETYTPNIDKLAKQALVFERAYCQQSVCAPSRNSFMTGRRPDTSKVWNFIDHFREKGVGLNWSSMPQYFKEHGYFSSGVGKVFHKNLPPNFDPPSWSDLSQFPWYYGDPGHCPKNTSWCALPRDHPFCDVNSTSIIIERLRYVAQNNSGPFFLAVGFHKPHLPWAFPEEFIKQYPNQSAISVAKFLYIPTGMPYIAFYNGMRPHKYSDLHRYTHNITTPYPVTVQQQLRRGYYAATTYMDSLVGKVLDELDRLGLSNDTIVALHGDHGYQLGEHNEWAKHTNFELATRVPFMIRVPWQPDTAGKKTSALVELVDVFPTLVELAGLPPCQENLDGLSLVPLFHNQTKTVKAAALSQYPRCGDYKNGNADVCLHTNRSQFNYMGYSMRTDRYRYTEWVKWNGTKLEGDWHGLVARELYDHQGDDGNDFNAFENENIAESQPEIVKELSLKLRNIFSKH